MNFNLTLSPAQRTPKMSLAIAHVRMFARLSLLLSAYICMFLYDTTVVAFRPRLEKTTELEYQNRRTRRKRSPHTTFLTSVQSKRIYMIVRHHTPLARLRRAKEKRVMESTRLFKGQTGVPRWAFSYESCLKCERLLWHKKERERKKKERRKRKKIMK